MKLDARNRERLFGRRVATPCGAQVLRQAGEDSTVQSVRVRVRARGRGGSPGVCETDLGGRSAGFGHNRVNEVLSQEMNRGARFRP